MERICKKGIEMEEKKRAPRIEFAFDPFRPVHVTNDAEVQAVFGDMYKYDFPKWCAMNGLRCFYKPETRVYVVIPKTLREL